MSKREKVQSDEKRKIDRIKEIIRDKERERCRE
jgi:hypothetical protein